MKIIVLTPIKNEEWILETFLTITSTFADEILIADQQSTDNSKHICAQYPKVRWIENHSSQFNEQERQLLLIETARELFGTNTLLLALDADEFLAANTLHSLEWDILKNLKPGTTICLEKPDLFKSLDKCFRYPNTYPIGFVDDGREHRPSAIHSIRIPMNTDQVYCCEEIKFIHFGLANFDRQLAKVRYYSVVENIIGEKGFLQRYAAYSPRGQESSFLSKHPLKESDPQWFEGWTQLGIDLLPPFTEANNWYYPEILKRMKEYGTRRFWLDDIWEVDWEQEARKSKMELHISVSPMIVQGGVWIMHKIKRYLAALLRKVKVDDSFKSN